MFCPLVCHFKYINYRAVPGMSKCFPLKNVSFHARGYGSRLICMGSWAPQTPQVCSCTLLPFSPRFSPLPSPPVPSCPFLSPRLLPFHFIFPSLFFILSSCKLHPLSICAFPYLCSHLFPFLFPVSCLHWNGWDQYDYAVGFAAATRQCRDVYVLQCLLFSYAYLCMHFAIYVDLYILFLCVSC